MRTVYRSVLLAALCSVAGAGVLFTMQQPAAPTVEPLGGLNGGPSWRYSEDIEGGVQLEVNLGFSQHVVDPATEADVRAISVHMNFLYGVGLMTQLDYLKLHAVNDSAPIVFDFYGVNRNVVVEQRPPFDPLDYRVTIAPKLGFTWGTVQGVLDLDFTVVAL